uniref:HTH tetR-type domain-containing protein n=1 Tax=Thermosporothrix sp. COM3 TaxID=2490863 RepID=A0A455SKU7_9CHLR|nr:hypothetical protein KTC_27490 [Thermosporothrix sp. COM3]
MGLREKNKQQKLERIVKAARELFAEKGYAETTTFEVAERAEIGTGTLFLYVKKKSELLLLVYGDVIRQTTDQQFATLPEAASLLDSLLHIFTAFFHLYEQRPDDAYAYIKEVLFHDADRLHSSHIEQFGFFLEKMAILVERAQERGEVAPDIDVQLASANFFSIYYMTLTSWLGGMRSQGEALEYLKSSLALFIRGLLPRS